ncbi:GDSL-type esterase/lipase family protein [Streptomyces sp. NPDC002033]|uniref:GDSL-type esterase/lipase family protein n=1 Tax=unclassified Streptomyces TaxID=2593676 RepID=UPI00332429C9
MTAARPARPVLLFQGDSITDAGRDRALIAGLGHGYAALVADRMRAANPALTILNRGVSGDRLIDLADRWEQDTLAHHPGLLSVLIGVNDTWRLQDSALPSPVDAWEGTYRHLLTRLRRRCGSQLVLIEPFLVPVTTEQWLWRPDLDARIHAVRRLAAEFDALLLAADGLLNQAARAAGRPELIAADGVHPTPLGHHVLAEAWAALVPAL